MNYYYTPFKFTDTNERQTWNYYLSKGSKFVTTASPVTKDNIDPDELGQKLVDEGLPNCAVNIRLLVCYGAGPSEIDEDYSDWDKSQNGASIAKNLAIALGQKLQRKYRLSAPTDATFRVAGYQGPTRTGYGRVQVKPGGAPNPLKPGKDDRGIAAAKRIHGAHADLQGRVRAYPRPDGTGKVLIVWYDSTGAISTKVPKATAASAAALTSISRGSSSSGSSASPVTAPTTPLGRLRDGDTLRIMAHGFLEGHIGPFAGPTMKGLTSAEANREERLAGKTQKVSIF